MTKKHKGYGDSANELNQPEGTMESDWRTVTEILESIEKEMKVHQERYAQFCAEYYWSGIKISNFSKKFCDAGAELMKRLSEYSEVMRVFAEQMEKLAQELLKDIYAFQCEKALSPEAIGQLEVIKRKISVMEICNQRYAQELEKYVRYADTAGKILNGEGKRSVSEKLKSLLYGNGGK